MGAENEAAWKAHTEGATDDSEPSAAESLSEIAESLHEISHELTLIRELTEERLKRG